MCILQHPSAFVLIKTSSGVSKTEIENRKKVINTLKRQIIHIGSYITTHDNRHNKNKLTFPLHIQINYEKWEDLNT